MLLLVIKYAANTIQGKNSNVFSVEIEPNLPTSKIMHAMYQNSILQTFLPVVT